MRYGIALPNYGALAAPATLVRIARRAEALGVDSVWVSDHLLAPVGVRSVYPYDRRPNPTPGDMGVIEHFYEPLATLAFLAGATSRVRLGVSAYVVPYRPPAVTAKQVATLDVLSGGRLLLAVGVGWLREEFEALGVPFAGRGRRTDEYLAVCRALWTEEVASFTGRTVQLPEVRGGPKPVQRPHPPLWIAGNSAAARARAARLGQGWHAIDLSPDELAPLVADLRARAEAEGRTGELSVSLRKGVQLLDRPPDPPHALYGDAASLRVDAAAYAASGCDYLVLTLRGARNENALERALEGVVAALG
jgi:probable F420-dependent oxidoreductase